MPVMVASETLQVCEMRMPTEKPRSPQTLKLLQALAERMACATHVGPNDYSQTYACRHPDKNLGKEEEARAEFHRVHAAYTKLSDGESDEEDASMYDKATSFDKDEVAASFFEFM